MNDTDLYQLGAIEGVAPPEPDMWDPYVKATVEHVPLAKDKIVFDPRGRFHIMKQLNEAPPGWTRFAAPNTAR